MIVFPNCKVNLGLHVLSKRPDGFHDIESCFYPVQWTDMLEFIENKDQNDAQNELIWSSSGKSIFSNAQNIAELEQKDNLIYKAYTIIAKTYKLPPLKVHLHKVIPMGAGLGGGSSDAAFFIKAINQYFKLGISLEERKQMAAQLGSDCSFFIENKACIASGKGEILEAINLDLSTWHIIVVHPNIHSDTKLAYAGIQANPNHPNLKTLLQMPINEWKNNVYNDFEPSVSARYPEILSIKKQLYNLGATYAAMSGSGSAVFGLFKDKIEIPIKDWNDYSVYQGILN